MKFVNASVAVEAEAGDVGRSARKRAAILRAAHALFLQKGYAGTSMDDVAAHAAVSKQTVYKNFADKQRLFTEVITSDVGRLEDSTQVQMAAMPDSADPAADLRWFAAWDRRGLLRVPDPVLAGRQFNWLVLSIPLNKAMAYATDEPLFTRAELDHYADEAVRVFLAAYGVPPLRQPA